MSLTTMFLVKIIKDSFNKKIRQEEELWEDISTSQDLVSHEEIPKEYVIETVQNGWDPGSEDWTDLCEDSVVKIFLERNQTD